MPSSAVLQSFIYGVCASSLFEELITRSYFVKYRMGIIEFLFFNIISSVAFSLMHAGFVATPLPLLAYITQRGHFGWSFMINILIYKTQRIEQTMIIHALSNIVHFTVPVLILGYHQAEPFTALICVCVEYVFLAFAVKREKT
jgi:membrane protease YdiL (CAAX protease family)